MLSLMKEKADGFFHSVKISEGKNAGGGIRLMSGLGALYRKEMADHIRSKRFLIVLCLILLTSFASVYGAVSVLSDAVASDPDYIFLKLFTLSGNSIPSFLSFIALLGPFVGLTLGFDAINSERSAGTLNRLVSQPIYRDCVINGKFLAGATVIFLMVFSMGLVIGAVGLLTIGIPPTADEVGRVLDYYDCQLALNRLSPYYLYSEAISTIMDPTVRSMNVILPQQLSDAISGYLSVGQSLLLVWPHLVGLLALTAVAFALSYISFMRREIRSR